MPWLYCPKFTLEDVKPPKGNLQVKEILETSTGSETQGLAIPVHRLYLIRHSAWWSQRSRQRSSRNVQQDHRKTFQEDRLKMSTPMGREDRRMSLGLPNNGQNPNKGYAIFLDIRMFDWKFRFYLCVLHLRKRWRMGKSIDCASKSWKL